MIITITSFKGGVGKSTISQNLAVAWAYAGKEVCILDTDPNENTSIWQQRRPDHLPPISVFPLGKTDILKTLKTLSTKYDLVLVDCPPATEKVSTKAIIQSDMTLIPIPTTGGGDLWATEQLLEHIDILKTKYDIDVPTYLLANRYEQSTTLHQQILKGLQAYQDDYPIQVLQSILVKRVAHGEANIQGMGIIEGTDPKAKAEMQALLQEIEQCLSTASMAQS